MARGGMPPGAALVMLVALGEAHGQAIFAHGFEESCAVDSDADRLADCEEVARLTDYTDADTDDDGLSDGDEVLGTLHGLDLPAMGVNPRHKDLLVEIDWTDDAFECPHHSHRPLDQTIEEVRLFYASLPVANVDGTNGITFIADYGQGGAFTGGNFIAITDGIAALGPAFDQWKATNLAANRVGSMRYMISGHRLAYGNRSSGHGDIGGDDSVITLRCLNTSDNVRNTIIHELGHNLGLQHGGDTSCHHKPNYNSLMNYNHQFDGLDTDCTIVGNGIDFLGYSDGTRNPLVQGALLEPLGVCAPGHPQHQPIDWNANGVIDTTPVSTLAILADECATTGFAHDHDDYAVLVVPPYSPQDGAPPPGDPPTSGECASPPEGQ